MSIPVGTSRINAYYGNPDANGNHQVDPAWEAANLETFTIPKNWDMRIAWDTTQKVKTFRFHKLAIPDLTEIFNELWAHARIRAKDKYGYDKTSEFYDLKTNEELKLAGLNLFGGAYNFRLKRGGSTLSMHSWGIAIDFDPANNAMGDVTPKIPMWVVSIFESHGWLWGGRWSGHRCDGMHFQRATGA